MHPFRAINPTPRLSALCLARTTGVRVDALRDSPPQHSADPDEGSILAKPLGLTGSAWKSAPVQVRIEP